VSFSSSANKGIVGLRVRGVNYTPVKPPPWSVSDLSIISKQRSLPRELSFENQSACRGLRRPRHAKNPARPSAMSRHARKGRETNTATNCRCLQTELTELSRAVRRR
jgi:hypothetical protein